VETPPKKQKSRILFKTKKIKNQTKKSKEKRIKLKTHKQKQKMIKKNKK